jgi:electron transport complex protein RnfG
MNEAPDKGGLFGRAWSYVRQAWLVIVLAVLYGGALAGVQTTLGPKIAQNKENETYDRIPELVPGADRQQTIDVNTANPQKPVGADDKEQRGYRAVAADGTPKGWVLPASGLGFADRIDLLIGLDADLSSITGLYVLDQKETPGLGNNITSPELFLSQFPGKSAAEQLAVVKTEPAAGKNQIRALTGATISSESVAEIVNKAIQNLREPIRQLRSMSVRK